EQSRALRDEFFETISALTSKFEDQTTNSLNQVPKVFQKNLFWGSSLVLLCVLLAFGFVIRNIWRIVDRINRVSNVMSDVANGSADLTTRIETESNDEIDAAVSSFNRMAQSLLVQTEREKEDNWLKSNIADITTEL